MGAATGARKSAVGFRRLDFAGQLQPAFFQAAQLLRHGLEAPARLGDVGRREHGREAPLEGGLLDFERGDPLLRLLALLLQRLQARSELLAQLGLGLALLLRREAGAVLTGRRSGR